MSGQVVGWGYKPNQHLGDKLFEEVRSSLPGKAYWHCLQPGDWAFVTRSLTPQKAIEKYGEITKVITGPRGGFKGVVYGKTQFCSRVLDPRDLFKINPSLIEII